MENLLRDAYTMYSEITGDATLKGFLKMLDKWENTREGRVMTVEFEDFMQEMEFTGLLASAFKAWCVGRSYYRMSHYMSDAELALKGFDPRMSTTKINEVLTKKEMA